MYHGERFNAWSHLIGAVLSAFGALWLLLLASASGDIWKIVSVAIYGVTLIVLYSASTLYHSVRGPLKKPLQKLDHLSIYLLIAGSYTPFCLVTLRGPEFGFDPEQLRAAFGPKTRAILVNTPHNPCGKVYSRAELELIASLCIEYDVLAITDEVYEHLVFEGEHLSLASLPGMRERTVIISSAGKTFSFTGWKIGHTCAPAGITRALRSAHQFVTFCNGTPFQYAMATGYRAPDEYFTGFLAEYRARRDKLCAGLAEVGFEVLTPAGTYFVQTDIRPLGYTDDFEFCRMLPREIGVAAIPTSAFYSDPEAGKHLVRFAFCKSDAVLDEALRRLHSLKKR
mgnify:CR=1 FL=1